MEIDDQQFETFKGEFFQFVKDENRQTRDLLMQEIRASEHRIETKFDKKLDKQKDEILEAVGDMLGGSIVPQIDDHEQRLTKLETKPA